MIAKLRMLGAVLSLGVLLAPLVYVSSAHAQAYPNRPVRLVYAFAPGSPAHSATLFIAQEASKVIGQPMLLEIKTGAGGRIGLDEALRSAPDGYTLGHATIAMLALQGGRGGLSRERLNQCLASFFRLRPKTALTALQFYRQREQARRILAAIERPDRVDQRRRVVSGLPACRDRSQLVLEVAVGHRIGGAAASSRIAKSSS